jgi:hypothetical protein
MIDSFDATAIRRQALRELLLTYLEIAGLPAWPGTDGLTVNDVLLIYLQGALSGRVPSRVDLMRAHPDLAVEIAIFWPDEHAQS